MNRDIAAPRWGNPTFWVLLALAFGNVFGPGEIGLHRPPADAAKSIAAGRVRARLWRDPLNVALAATQGWEAAELQGISDESLVRVRSGLKGKLRSVTEPADKEAPTAEAVDQEVLFLVVAMRTGTHAEAHEKRLRARYAVTAALLDQVFVPDDPEHLELLVLPHEKFGLVHAGQGQGDGGGEGSEAVHPLHDAMVALPYQWFTAGPRESKVEDGEDKAQESQGAKRVDTRSVLVLWVDEGLLGDAPLSFHDQLLGTLLENEERALERVRVASIGPTTSDGLVALLDEARHREPLVGHYLAGRRLASARDVAVREAGFETENGRAFGREADRRPSFLAASGFSVPSCPIFHVDHLFDQFCRQFGEGPASWSHRVGGIEVLSPWSTAELGDSWREKDAEGCEDHEGVAAQCFPSANVHVQRLIGKDRVLADNLVLELAARIPALMPALRTTDVDVEDAEFAALWSKLRDLLHGRGFLRDAEEDVRVALIVEEDTLYGRSWLRTLKEAWARHCTDLRAKHGEDLDLPELSFDPIPFLRGIDGYVQGKEANEGGANDYPAGTGQIDYLRRLQSVLERGEHDYDAVGVFGTDAYDELIILEALVPLFPDTTFFTTDLDVRFQAERHLSYARNLVVASHYGLSRRPADLGSSPSDRRSPPIRFRDSYQTSQYKAVEVALRGQEALPVEMTKEGQAYLYEVGKHGSVALTNSAVSAMPSSEKLSTLGPMVFSLTVLVLVFVLLSPVSRFFRNFAEHVTWPSWVVFLLIVAATIGCCVVLFEEVDSERLFAEPFEWFQGVSVWPAVFLRVAGSAFCLISILYLTVEGRRSQRQIERDLFRYQPDDVSMWERAPARFKAVLQESLETRGRNLSEGAKESGRKWRIALGQALSRNQEDIVELWRQRYVFWNHPGWRVVRSLLYTMAFVALMLPVFHYFGRPGSPTRGEVALLADKGSMLFFVVALMTLIFYVLDSNWHAIRFLRDHLREDLGNWPKHLLERAPVELAGPVEAASLDETETAEGKGEPEPEDSHEATRKELQRRYLSVRLTADLTHTVQTFIYFPAIGVCWLLASRLDVFDRWAWPTALVLAFTVILGFLIVCAWNLSLAGLSVKAHSIRHLQRLRQKAGHDRELRTSIDERITELEELRGGAFSPLPQHPIVRAALLPLAFLGSGSLITYYGMFSGG